MTQAERNANVDGDHAAELGLLRGQLEAANVRLVQARHTLAERTSASNQVLRAELAQVRERLAQLERSHQEAMAAVQDGADMEAARVVDEARGAAEQMLAELGPIDVTEDGGPEANGAHATGSHHD